MHRRKFLIGLGGTAIGASALVGTGAFSRVESQRRVKVQIAHDSDAYLGILRKDPDEYPNASFTGYDEKGHFYIEMSPENPTTIGEEILGEGVNSDSHTWFDDLFAIRNQGKQPVYVQIEYDPVENGENRPAVRFYNTGTGEYVDGIDADDFEGLDDESGEPFMLEVGEHKQLGMMTDTKSLSEGEQLIDGDEVVITAWAPEEEEPEPTPTPTPDGDE